MNMVRESWISSVPPLLPHEIGAGQVVHVEPAHNPEVHVFRVWTVSDSLDENTRWQEAIVVPTGQPFPYGFEYAATTVREEDGVAWHVLTRSGSLPREATPK